eukprot:c20773_g4_i3.p1 GENE.c20773_g4_i3~~c20773_g4_i3.p1  ORF type:complete len:365 (+),score=112.09 c20773_g4_i3:133-1227(+)
MELLNCGTTSDAVHLWRSMGCKDVWELMTTKAFGELAPPVQARFKTIANCLEGLYKTGPTSYNNNSNGSSKANGAGEEEEVSRLEVVIAGAGPSGLRLAISQAAMGAKVTIWEKRQSCTRRNVLHLWTSTLADLKAIGARAVNPKLGNGPIHHASIRELQRVLMIIALLAGARVELEVQYAGHRRATHQEQQQQQQHQQQQDKRLFLIQPILLGRLIDASKPTTATPTSAATPPTQTASAVGVQLTDFFEDKVKLPASSQHGQQHDNDEERPALGWLRDDVVVESVVRRAGELLSVLGVTASRRTVKGTVQLICKNLGVKCDRVLADKCTPSNELGLTGLYDKVATEILGTVALDIAKYGDELH